MVLEGAVNIIDVNEEGDSFVLDEPGLRAIFETVPEDMPISIVSVVGVFRTGKSLLLDLCLHYLNSSSDETIDSRHWLKPDGKINGDVSGGNYSKKKGFGWKHGAERCTTGIWLWSQYFVRSVYDKESQQSVKTAVFLMDTQGLHDKVTGQNLTNAIFCLSTLISSLTVYNIKDQIQEDHLQQLASFSAYSRVAMSEEHGSGISVPPLQSLEFLVRDYSHLPRGEGQKFLDAVYEQAAKYLKKSLETSNPELREVRDQIDLCFEHVGCSLLPHPGLDVSDTQNGFDGSVKIFREVFRALAEDFVHRLFQEKIVIKKVLGEPVKGMQLFEHIKVYCNLFAESEIFPEAKTMLRQTQEASISSAAEAARKLQTQEMDKVDPFIDIDGLDVLHEGILNSALEKYESLSKIGSGITLHEETKEKLKSEMKDFFEDCKKRFTASQVNNLFQSATSAFALYNAEMDRADPYMQAKDLTIKHESIARNAMKLFEGECKVSSSSSLRESKIQELDKDMLAAFGKFSEKFHQMQVTSMQKSSSAAFDVYKREMRRLLGVNHISPTELENHHESARNTALRYYFRISKLGSNSSLYIEGESVLERYIEEKGESYKDQNSLKAKPRVVKERVEVEKVVYRGVSCLIQ